MAIQYVDPNGGNFIIPGAYPSVKVAAVNSGLSTTGVLVLIGEADSGPGFSSEEDLNLNSYGPDELPEVVAKYKGGNLVEAFRQASGAIVDPNITGAFQRAILVKTNQGAKATSVLQGFTGDYCTLADLSFGSLGNRIYYTVTQSTKEVAAATGSFTFIPPVGTVDFNVRISGDTEITVNVPAETLPDGFNALLGVALVVDGGIARNPLAVAAGVSVDADVNGDTKQATFTKDGANWLASISAGDTLVIPAASNLAGAGNENVGGWVVLSVNGLVLTAKKLSDAAMPGAVPGAVTDPIDVALQAAQDNNDLQIYTPLTASTGSSTTLPIDGIGRTLEINELGTGTDLLSRTVYALSATPVTWVSKDGAPVVLNSAAEYVASLNVNRQVDGISENLVAGGEIALKLSYVGYSAEFEIAATTVTLTTKELVGSTPVVTVLNLAEFPTIADLASYIDSLSGWSATPGTAVLGNLPSTALDRVTGTAASTFGTYTGRVKIDAYRFFNAVTNNSSLVQINNPAQRAAAGLPQPTVTGVDPIDPNASAFITYLAGGSKGATLAADIVAAVDACEKVRANFVVPLFSRDASEDIADGLTDSSSTYTIDAINSYVKTHVHKMSTTKARRNRQAFLSKRGTFAVVGNAAANIASFRCAMVFEDFKAAAGNGTIVQFQPWMGAVLAAATQAGAFYQSLVQKLVNTNGVLQAAGDWTFNSDSDLEKALMAGLLPVSRFDTGGFYWVSDQTTYGKDSTALYNSIQMVYAADVVALTTAQRMERAFVGKSLADVNATIALSYLDGIMADFLRLKLIAPSDDAPLGYRNAVIKIVGPAMRVSVEVKIAGSIYFIPITFFVTEIVQTASQTA